MNFTLDDLELGISRATQALIKQQRGDGHWVFELEADATIPAEYVLMVHYFAETPNLELERKIGQQALEIDFLKGCLQRIEEQRMLQALTGNPPSTGRSKKK